MKKLLLALAVPVSVLALAGVGGATAAKNVTLKLDDAFTVKGTSLLCPFARGTVHFAGKRAIGCVKMAAANVPAVGSYVAAVAEDGEVVVAKWTSKTTSKAVFRRKLASRAGASGVYPGTVGDTYRAAGTDLACGITKSAGQTLATCFKYDRGGVKPNTYAVAITDAVAIVLKFDAQRRPKAVFNRQHGK